LNVKNKRIIFFFKIGWHEGYFAVIVRLIKCLGVMRSCFMNLELSLQLLLVIRYFRWKFGFSIGIRLRNFILIYVKVIFVGYLLWCLSQHFFSCFFSSGLFGWLLVYFYFIIVFMFCFIIFCLSFMLLC
jgi:hypothetical protein